MADWLQNILLWFIPVIVSVSWHEVSHAYIAKLRGDKTAKDSGRLKWNPFYHLDGIGSILIPLTMVLLNSGLVYGWGKPLPINVNILKKPVIDRALVAVSGLGMTIILAFAFALLGKVGAYATASQINQLGFILTEIANNGVNINMVIFMVNLIPIPPLDAGRLAESFMNKRQRYFISLFEPFALIFVVALLFFTHTKDQIVPTHQYLTQLVDQTTDTTIDAVKYRSNKLWLKSLKALGLR
jgi:Zn-dependent protease